MRTSELRKSSFMIQWTFNFSHNEYHGRMCVSPFRQSKTFELLDKFQSY